MTANFTRAFPERLAPLDLSHSAAYRLIGCTGPPLLGG
jgi:hypothetical protein